MTVPTSNAELPDSVRALAAGRPCRAVWRNELGGLTFEVSTADGREFIKWAPHGGGSNLSGEVPRLRWAASWSAVPTVLDSGAAADGEWIVTAGLPGDNAVSDRWIDHPEVAVTAIGRGLRALHDTLPLASCPFSWSVVGRVADAHRRAGKGRITADSWHPEHRDLDVPAALSLLDDAPDVDRLVVCHGDACAPNTLIDDDGLCSGHVDFGSLGIADRWADLAVATWSTQWNYGSGWENTLLEAYGVDPDPRRCAYYRLLWDLGP